MEDLVKHIMVFFFFSSSVVQTAGVPLCLAYVVIILPLTDEMFDTHTLCAALCNPPSIASPLYFIAFTTDALQTQAVPSLSALFRFYTKLACVALKSAL